MIKQERELYKLERTIHTLSWQDVEAAVRAYLYYDDKDELVFTWHHHSGAEEKAWIEVEHDEMSELEWQD